MMDPKILPQTDASQKGLSVDPHKYRENMFIDNMLQRMCPQKKKFQDPSVTMGSCSIMGVFLWGRVKLPWFCNSTHFCRTLTLLSLEKCESIVQRVHKDWFFQTYGQRERGGWYLIQSGDMIPLSRWWLLYQANRDNVKGLFVPLRKRGGLLILCEIKWFYGVWLRGHEPAASSSYRTWFIYPSRGFRIWKLIRLVGEIIGRCLISFTIHGPFVLERVYGKVSQRLIVHAGCTLFFSLIRSVEHTQTVDKKAFCAMPDFRARNSALIRYLMTHSLTRCEITKNQSRFMASSSSWSLYHQKTPRKAPLSFFAVHIHV